MKAFLGLQPAARAGLHHAARCLLGGLATYGLTSLAAMTAAKAETPAEASSPDAAAASLLVTTREGQVRGVARKGVREFLGIPFAAPPVGELRWRPPQAHPRWDKPIDATAFGNRCAQIDTLGVFAKPSNHEDCLYLNVFAPLDGRAAAARAKRPVMVWIHGGGLFDGESNDYDGSKLAKDGDTVVVTINYRLNVFGFFSHPALDAEHHVVSNYGLMDQQFALKWVGRNIASFGGDPENVTIFGESAGAVSVTANMASPTARGLFHRGIAESVGLLSVEPSLATAEEVGKNFATAVGCKDQAASCLRSLSVKDILAKEGSFRTGIVVDGTVMTRTTGEAFSSGKFNRVPLINGSNRDELRFFIAMPSFNGNNPLKNASDYREFLKFRYGENASKVLAGYPLRDYNSVPEAAAATFTDSFVCGALRFNNVASRYVPVYAYEFADRKAPSFAPLQSFPYGAAHTFEIQYLFPLYHGGLGKPHPLSAAQEKLSDDMVSYWTTFARTGNPNSGETADWPRYTAAAERFLALRTPSPVVITNFAAEHHCAFWDSQAGNAVAMN